MDTKRRRLVLSAGMIACHGQVQREGEVIHVIADRLEHLSDLSRSVGKRDKPFPTQHGRGDGATHPDSPDPAERAGCWPWRLSGTRPYAEHLCAGVGYSSASRASPSAIERAMFCFECSTIAL
jgi:hypothetical protein